MKTNYLYNENCLDTMSRMQNNYLDLTVTSPPYDNLRAYNGFDFDWKAIIKELYRVTKEGGVVVWVVGDATIKGSETGTSFKQALHAIDCGFNLHDTMIFLKNSSAFPSKTRYSQVFEYMFVFSKGKPKSINLIKVLKSERTLKDQKQKASNKIKEIKQRGVSGDEIVKRLKYNVETNYCVSKNVILYKNNFTNKKKGMQFKHPATFPEQLANDHIMSWSNEGDLVYDPFMGSGTTAKMAIINKRKWIGSEMSSDYCDIIHERLKQFDDDMFLNDKD